MATTVTGTPGLATTAKTGASASDKVSSATSAIDQLQKQVAELQKVADQKKLTVVDYRKDTKDVQFDNRMTARDIGTLKDQKTRLNLFSALSANDSVDVFRFRVDKAAKTRIGVLIANVADRDAVRIQIFSRNTGRVVADNDPKSGDAKAAYDSLQAGDFEMPKGDYILRISRQDGVDRGLKKNYSYALQLSQGTYSEDYDTVEQAKKADGSNPYGFGSVSIGTTNLVNGLTSAYSTIASLPRIGTSATDKLSGVLLDALS